MLNQKTVRVGVICLLIAALFWVEPLFCGGAKEAEEAPEGMYPEEVATWLKETKIGPFQEKEVDYEAIYQAALAEGKVVIYAGSSRVPKVIELFNETYPGIEVESAHLGTAGAIQKVFEEQKAGIYKADLLQASLPSRQVFLLHENHMLFPWIPPDLKEVIPERWQKPLLAWIISGKSVAYNHQTYPEGQPFQSLWDLTKPEWRRKIFMTDPRVDAAFLDFCTNVVLRADEMAAEYKRVFGKPIELTTDNAGYEWLRRIIQNEPQLFAKDKEVATVLGAAGQEAVSISTSLSRYRQVGDPAKGNQQFWPAVDTTPKFSHVYPNLLNIVYKAPHPNAAKLFLHFLMGDEQGKAGYAPWFIIGNWPVRADIGNPPVHPFTPELEDVLWPFSKIEDKTWFWDPENLQALYDSVLDFLIDELG